MYVDLQARVGWYIISMLKKLKALLLSSPLTAKSMLLQAKIDSTCDPIRFMPLRDTIKLLNFASTRNQLLEELFTGLHSDKWQKRVKYLIAVHHFVEETGDGGLVDGFVSQCEEGRRNGSQGAVTVGAAVEVAGWIQECVIRQYQGYVLKLCCHMEFWRDCRNRRYEQEDQRWETDEMLVKGFEALNLVNFILQTRVSFNKLGRYYPQYKVMIDLYKMYLSDVTIFYEYLKHLLDQLLTNPESLSKPQLKHSFAFINESLKTFDQLYEFYYNRYYCQRMAGYEYPLFYKLDLEKYRKFVKYVKRNLPLEEFHEMEIYFNGYRKEGVTGGTEQTHHTMSKDQEEICCQLERTLAVMEGRRGDGFGGVILDKRQEQTLEL